MIKIPRGVILPEALLIIDAATVVVTDGSARVTVGEVKVFPDRGGHTDPQQLASARAQAGIYRHALEITVSSLGLADDLDIASDGFLVFTWPGSNSPSIRIAEDLTYQAILRGAASTDWRRSPRPSCARTISPPTTRR